MPSILCITEVKLFTPHLHWSSSSLSAELVAITDYQYFKLNTCSHICISYLDRSVQIKIINCWLMVILLIIILSWAKLLAVCHFTLQAWNVTVWIKLSQDPRITENPFLYLWYCRCTLLKLTRSEILIKILKSISASAFVSECLVNIYNMLKSSQLLALQIKHWGTRK